MTTVWDRDPPDGFCCLVRTRRVLDDYGNCCDYNRCGAYQIENGRVRDRCLMDDGHAGRHHGGRSCYRPMRVDAWAPGRLITIGRPR